MALLKNTQENSHQETFFLNTLFVQILIFLESNRKTFLFSLLSSSREKRRNFLSHRFRIVKYRHKVIPSVNILPFILTLYASIHRKEIRCYGKIQYFEWVKLENKKKESINHNLIKKSHWWLFFFFIRSTNPRFLTSSQVKRQAS